MNTEMHKSIFRSPLFWGAVVGLLLPACGAQPYDLGTQQGYYNGGQTYYSPTSTTGTTTTTSSSTSTSTSTSSSSSTQVYPNYSATFSLNGVGGTKTSYTFPVSTDQRLVVKVRANAAGTLSLPGDTTNRFSAQYACIRFNITVNGRTQTSKNLKVNGQTSVACPDAVDEDPMDFSDRLTPGHGVVNVVVDSPSYDWYCQMWYSCQYNPYNPTCMYSFGQWMYGNYCPTTTVYKTHTVGGTLNIEYDTTN